MQSFLTLERRLHKYLLLIIMVMVNQIIIFIYPTLVGVVVAYYARGRDSNPNIDIRIK